MQNLRNSLETARAKGVEVRGIAVINPGNPTGNILAEEQIKDIIQVRCTVNSRVVCDFEGGVRTLSSIRNQICGVFFFVFRHALAEEMSCDGSCTIMIVLFSI